MTRKNTIKKLWLTTLTTLFSVTVLSTSLASCSLLPRPQHQDDNNQKPNNDSSRPDGPDDNEQTPNPDQPGNGGNTGGDNGNNEPIIPPPFKDSPFGHDKWYHGIPNPNFAKYPDNSFLLPESKPGPDTIYPSSPRVPKFAKLEYGQLTNQRQIQNAKMSYSVRFSFGGMGTAWILDYQIPEGVDESQPGFQYDDTNYPTTWYFATNVHVLDYFSEADKSNSLYPSISEPVSQKIDLTYLINPRLGVKYNNASNSSNPNDPGTGHDPQNPTLPADLKNWWKERLWIHHPETQIPNNAQVRKVYMGYDYLTTSPRDYNQHPKFVKGVQEYADFGVFEVKFLNASSYTNGFDRTSYDVKATKFARHITNDYANWKPQDKFKYKKTDLLNDRPALGNQGLNIVGFPLHDTNAPSLYVNRPKDNTANHGSPLATAPHYTTFGNKAVMDNAIGKSSFIGYTTVDKVEYATWGLTYPSDYGNLAGGSSGSLVTDDQGYAWGIHYLSDQGASIGLAQAFYSKGYNYNGKYGNYNLPAYDLISGEPLSAKFPQQRSSYRDNLTKLYKATPNMRTNLFPKGVNHTDYK